MRGPGARRRSIVVRGVGRRVDQRGRDLLDDAVPAGHRLFGDEDHIAGAQFEPRGKQQVRCVAGIEAPGGGGAEFARIGGGAQHVDLAHVAGLHRHAAVLEERVGQRGGAVEGQRVAALGLDLAGEIDVVAVHRVQLEAGEEVLARVLLVGATDVHLGVERVERGDAGFLAELGKADLFLEVGLGQLQLVGGVDEDAVAVDQPDPAQPGVGIELRERDLVERAVAVDPHRGVVLVLHGDAPGGGQGLVQVERGQGDRGDGGLRHGAADGDLARVELGDLEAEGRVDLVFHQPLEEFGLGFLEGQPGDLHAAHVGDGDGAVVLYRVALTRVGGRQQPRELFDRVAGLRGGEQHHVAHADLVGAGVGLGGEAGFQEVLARAGAEGRFGRGARAAQAAAGAGGGEEDRRQGLGAVGGAVGHHHGFGAHVHHPQLAVRSGHAIDGGAVVDHAAAGGAEREAQQKEEGTHHGVSLTGGIAVPAVLVGPKRQMPWPVRWREDSTVPVPGAMV